ncbi:MAG: class I SAM-dependent methyltransferase [Marinobacter sp.]|uniref:class I SAM-dependent methyltransferase n=1 Tax=Marinobacter sp. TaxID=50741 RepID=UPI00299E994A|nr:class I SAM-dependent methyltransferase [Marinobacter sp.]MDX1754538.1 class I SAM-dependent methyltransferase [Marinobacter sp.]
MPESPSESRHCTVCRQPGLRHLLTVRAVPYWRCPTCEATLMDPTCWLDAVAEKQVYDLHHNDPSDPGYRRFLAKLTDPLIERLPSGARGLEFGCGPGPALATMLTEQGFAMTLFDPYYHPNQAVLESRYQFVTCTEVIEHLHDPWSTFAQFDQLLEPGGWLGIMTCFQTDDARFANWHYRRDPTHVVFYRESTLAHIARRFDWTLHIPVKDVALFQKPL